MAETDGTGAAATSRRQPWIPALASFLIVSFLAISVQITISIFSPISPHPYLQLPSAAADLPVGEPLMQRLSKLGEGDLKDPEDVGVDTAAGILYTATRDGWIKRVRLLDGNGSDWENWKNFKDSQSLLGIAIAKEGGVLVCDAREGLLKVDRHGFSLLVSSSIVSFADDVVEAADGSVYFSDASTKFGLHNWYLDFLEAKPHGRLLKYDPNSSNQISTLLDNLHFANGVALSKDQTYVLVCESFRYRCVKYWLKGDKQGETEIFIDNLPGAPDNINLAPDGSFWIALLQPVREGTEWFVRSKMARHILATFPKLYELFIDGTRRRSTVVKVSEDGRIVRKLEDRNGKVLTFVTSALEFEDHLYLGSLNANFIGKLPLT